MNARRLAVLAAVAAALVHGTATAAPGPAYVALGDSFTSGSAIPPLDTTPYSFECTRSTRNYPHLFANAIAPAAFTDVSCSGATTGDMTNSQNLGYSVAPPQFEALRSDTRLVTVGIGGNDVPVGEIFSTCGQLDTLRPTGSPCKDHYTSSGTDAAAAKVAAVAPKLAAVIQGIHARSPQARILAVGYPVVVPTSRGCWPTVPISEGDVVWLDGFVRQINAMVAEQARANGAEYVDTYTSSLGHDMCKPSGVKWIEGLLPNDVTAPVHPNALGHINMAKQVERVFNHPPAAAPPPPPTMRCTSARRFTIRIRPTGRALRSASVKVGGRRVRARRSSSRRWTAVVDLRPFAGGNVIVETLSTYRDRRRRIRTLRDVRRYRVCAPRSG